jgi:hypothetical protein
LIDESRARRAQPSLSLVRRTLAEPGCDTPKSDANPPSAREIFATGQQMDIHRGCG